VPDGLRSRLTKPDRRLAELEEFRRRIEEDLSVAARVHRSLIPRSLGT
jgi:hypothetical protein